MQLLEQKGLLDHTILVYTSDNGMLLGEHGAFNEKRWAYEPSIKVPFYIRYPKLINAGSKSDELVLNLDFAPTIYDLTNTSPYLELEGQSFASLFGSGNSDWREAFMAEYHFEQVVPKVPAWKCLRTKDWKYIQYQGEDEKLNELYHLANDPEEIHNLHNAPEYTKQWQLMKEQLSSLDQ